MSEPTHPSRRALGLQFLVIVILLPILYVAASGPFYWAAAKFGDRAANWDRLRSLYYPLFRAAHITDQEAILSGYFRIYGLRTMKVAGKVGTQQSLAPLIVVHPSDK